MAARQVAARLPARAARSLGDAAERDQHAQAAALAAQVARVLGDAAERDLLLFCYGSLIWKAEPEFASPRHCRAVGLARRFYQRSDDHRGTPSEPGRVCTLLRADDDEGCHGTLFLLPAAAARETMSRLCVREKAGYTFEAVSVELAGGDCAGNAPLRVAAFAFVSRPGGYYLEPESGAGRSDAATAEVIATAVGPSGANLDYFLPLLSAMRQRGVRDAHLEALFACMLAGAHADTVRRRAVEAGVE